MGEEGSQRRRAASAKAPPAAKVLKDGELLKVLVMLAISHDESLRALEATHHSTFLLPASSLLAEALKTVRDKYHQSVEEPGLAHQMGPPFGYLLMALVAELQKADEKLPSSLDEKKA